MRYRKGETVVNAVQFHPHIHPWPDGAVSWHTAGEYQPRDGSWGYVLIVNGKKHIQDGDWIITESTGAKQVYPDAAFRSEYELVREPGVLTEDRIREIVQAVLDQVFPREQDGTLNTHRHRRVRQFDEDGTEWVGVLYPVEKE